MAVPSIVSKIRRSGRGRRGRGRGLAAALVAALALQLAATVPAQAAEDDIPLAEMRDVAAVDLIEGGPAVRRAAEAALVGSDADVQTYYESGYHVAREADERAAVQVLAGLDGPSTRAAALAALEKPRAQMQAFARTGWQAPWDADERLRVYHLLESGGPTVRAAAQRALDGTAEDIDRFLGGGRESAEHSDDRLAATRMLTGGPGNSGPVLNTAAAQALSGSAEDLREFLRWGQFVARARDAELASIRSLTEQARQAGETTSREALAAEESSTRAANAAEEAKRSALAAEKEAREAGNDARKASAAAGRAADAAEGAAAAAREAVAASNAAMRAARVAADAARKATTAAALTAQAATRAQKAAAAARLNAGDARAAREAAEAARDAAARAKELEQVRAERDRALAQAQAASAAAQRASANADAAGVAADTASRQSGVSAHQAQRARAAAAQARAAARTADRAADRAEALARQAAEASAEAFQFAQQAAQHAENAVTQAIAAAEAAERAQLSAEESYKHAQAAVNAANVAVQAANQAVELEALAREEDRARLAEWTEQGIQTAQAALEAENAQLAVGGEPAAWNRSLLWDTAEQDRIDPATRTLLAEATAAGAPADVVRDRGRRAAASLVQIGGEWTKQAAQAALAGDEAELRVWLAEGRRVASGQDDRARVWRLIDILPDGAEKTAARTALEGDDAAVETFLRTRNYSGKLVRDRQQAYALLQGAGPNLTAAANRALAGTPQELHQFLRTGQYPARAADERLEVYRIVDGADSGPEVDAAAKVALAGPASYLSYFLTTSRFQAQQRDLEQAAHVSTVTKLIAEAQKYAQTALEDADRAVSAAQRARGYAAEADAAKARADRAAQQAVAHANAAAASAEAARKSADAAAESAAVARNAANRAKASADQAARSAATATAAASRAQADAAAAHRAKQSARASAQAAGADAAAAAQAAKEATIIYAQRLEQAERDRRSTAPGSGPGGQGTAADNHKTWGCLSLDASNVSKECLTVFKDFADALINPAKCAAPANASTTGCAMLGDLKQFAKENGDLLLDMLQFTLMACGLIPGAGEVCDAIDAAVSFGRGDWAGGLLSLGSAIPVIGWAATGLKAWKNSDKFRNIQQIVEQLGKACRVRRPNSFVRGTRVLLADGRTKKIEEIRAGDSVAAADPYQRRTAAKVVVATVSTVGVKQLVDISVDDDGKPATPPAVVTATADHPFWVPASQRWQPARSLGRGTAVQTLSGERALVTAVTTRTETLRAYNLTVDGLPTYHVMAGDKPLLVHNDGPATPPTVSDQRLQNFIRALYKGVGNPNLVGDGTAMSAASSEVSGGGPVEGRNHVNSTTQYRSGLRNWLANNPNASEADRRVAQGLISSIDDALNGSYRGAANYPGLDDC
ncbi:polymorphic toxin-type HINT domain-containing protein [Jidongwangia harbinensis]|uniref:polymorphic toxin-type HINT domain-containing protein n=1 Tax=Jidongwangia harbinensis TaxID=2878561 RepID=UPI001CD979D1|nr:polymorphic toxin-type HINT domain-containing protein [Jidongwangia harbinensis]MCA2217641.1 hypothetical protein [Jidongwangia harbinensis]